MCDPTILLSNSRGGCRLEPTNLYQLVSSSSESIPKNRKRLRVEGHECYLAVTRPRPTVSGNLREFRSPEILDKGQAYMGAVLLLGEIGLLNEVNVRRHKHSSRIQFAFSWTAAFNLAVS